MVTELNKMGPGTLLAKIDMKSAHSGTPSRQTPPRYELERWYLCRYSSVLGLRSAPKIFNAVADTLEWILQQNGV